MLKAAYELVCELGYEATTMAAIAERAGVAVQTLYFTFHTKPAVLSEVLHASVVGFDLWSPALNRDVHRDHRSVAREKMPWFRPFEAESDPRKAIALYVEGTAEILARVGPLLVNLGAQPTAELQATLTDSERLREEACTMIVSALRTKGRGLRASLSVSQAVDIFFVLTRAELYYDLTVRRAWSHAQAKTWLTQLLAQQLLAEP
ncbi:MAG: helix-turn-helix domain-containing protein [Polyangiaceae bacterium]|nr:helix-turn-helix domain-containing protein [Polyangiaceae bacterium]